DLLGGTVPRQHVPAPPGDVGWLLQAFDQPQDRWRHHLARERALVAVMRQRLQMRVLGLAEPQCPRQRVDRGDRRADRAALLEPDVPVDADAGELRDLFATQARGSPPAAERQADRFRRQLLAARSQEIAEFNASRIGHVSPVMLGPWNTRIIPGLLVPSK